MSGSKAEVKPRPCSSCPYRRDVPSGVWHSSEYFKLPEYDAPTAEQPPGEFRCHQNDGCICRGWVDVHGAQSGGNDLLSLRLLQACGCDISDIAEAINDGPQVEVFGSGEEACKHGIAEIENPTSEAFTKMAQIKKVRELK